MLKNKDWENKDLRDNEDLDVKVVKFMWLSVKLFARD